MPPIDENFKADAARHYTLLLCNAVGCIASDTSDECRKYDQLRQPQFSELFQLIVIESIPQAWQAEYGSFNWTGVFPGIDYKCLLFL